MLQPLQPNASLTSLPARLHAHSAQDSDVATSMLPGAPTQPLVGHIELLTNSTQLLPALLDVIYEAKTSLKVDFQLLQGATGRELARLLARRVRQGLRVQVLAWGTSPALVEAVKAARSQGLTVRLNPTPGQAEAGRFMVADDRLALIGSMFSATRSRLARRGLLRLTGEAACELGRQFNHDWAAAGGTPMPLPDMGLVARSTTYETLSAIHVGGNGPQRRSARRTLLGALQRAKGTIEVMIDVLDDAEVLDALVAATKRGVKVKVLVAGHATLDRPSLAGLWQLDPQARAIGVLLAAGVPVRRFHVNGQPQAVELRYGLVDGETLLFGSLPWTRTGFKAGGEVLLEARGGRELLGIRAAFLHDWHNAAPAEPPRGLGRLTAEVAPAMAALNRVVRRFSPAGPVKSLLNLHVGVVKYADGKWKLIADVR